MDRELIVEKIKNSADRYGASNKQQIKQLLLLFKKASDRELFFGLFSFFYDPKLQENVFERQQLAGTVLYEIKPKCPLNLDGAILATPAYWDLSVEEFPWYLCEQFGQKNVQDFLDEFSVDVSDEKIKRGLKTMLFWANRYKSAGT